MLVAALDTTTRLGSVAVVADGRVLTARAGDPTLPHATRLPGDLLEALDTLGLAPSDVDVFGVAAGPGSFTGLRIGLAAIQGLAFAARKRVVAVSAFEATAATVWWEHPEVAEGWLAVWLDAQRAEVYGAVLRSANPHATQSPATFQYAESPSVGAPDAVLDRWRRQAWWGSVAFVGDGALAYRSLLVEHAGAGLRIVEPTPWLAPAVGQLAWQRAAAGLDQPPHAVKPLYIRRPDAELARDRQSKLER